MLCSVLRTNIVLDLWWIIREVQTDAFAGDGSGLGSTSYRKSVCSPNPSPPAARATSPVAHAVMLAAERAC